MSNYKSTGFISNWWLYTIVIVIGLSSSIPVKAAELSLAYKPLFISAGYLPSILVIIDNSNSMDEAANGSAVGSDAENSKSEIARGVIKDLIETYDGQINLGLMAYQQSNAEVVYLYNAIYDASFDPDNFDEEFSGDRDSLTKKYRVENTSSSGDFVHYNVALPFYTTDSFWAPSYCYSADTDFDNDPDAGTTSSNAYDCYRVKNDASDIEPIVVGDPGFFDKWASGTFSPTDSDIAQGIFEFGKFLAINSAGSAWFSNSSPGRGYLHTPIKKLDSTQELLLNKKLDTSQFSTNAPTDNAYPLQNAGLTPLEGTLYTARDYFANNLSEADEGYTNSCYPLPESCGFDYVILITDGLPSVDKDGNITSDVESALTAVETAAAALLTNAINTYVVGFALPDGFSADQLDKIAAAGGTTSAFSANDPESLEVALESIFENLLLESSSAAAVALNTTSWSDESRLFQAKFNSIKWTGELIMFTIAADGSLSEPSLFSSVLDDQSWDDRVIVSYNSATFDGTAFRWDNISAAQQTIFNDNLATPDLDDDGHGSERLNYIRGSSAYNGSVYTGNNGTVVDTSDDASYTVRARISMLGDLIHSAPYFVGAPSNTYPSDLETAAYNDFRAAKINRTQMVYVGANDGMVHGFRTEDSIDGSISAGTELLAFIPNEVFKNLNQLTDSTYKLENNKHTYFVDGAPIAGDAFFTGDSAWHTVLAGGLNAGGQSIYALDITDPSTFTEANAANIVLWEYTDADLGYTFSQVAIVRMQNGKWAAVFGNGYNNTEADGSASVTGNAYLYIVDIEDGSLIKKIDTGVGSVSTPNGLSTPAPVDIDGDFIVDYIYAGDLQGNMWKFDVSDKLDAKWVVAYDDGATPSAALLPLYTALDDAGSPLPITTRPEIGKHPAVEDSYMVYFGTGKYIETDDNSVPPSNVNTDDNAFYGIWDKNESPLVAFTNANLLQQEIIFESSDDGTAELTTTNADEVADYDIRVTSDYSIDWVNNHMGWRMKLPTNGERQVSQAILRHGNIIFTTLIPSLNVCEYGGTGWLMELDAFDGSRVEVFDLDGDGLYTDDYKTITVINDDGEEEEVRVPVSGKKSKSGIISSPAILTKGNKEFKYSSGSRGNVEVTVEKNASEGQGRVSWQQLQ